MGGKCTLVSGEMQGKGKFGRIVRWSVHVRATFEYIAHLG